MPKPRAFVRHRRWTLKTSPDLWHPRLSALHPVSSELVRHAYLGIDQVYVKVSRILDKHGVVGCLRGGYRSYAEELWKQSIMHTKGTLNIDANAIFFKYFGYGLDCDILREIAFAFGIEVRLPVPVVIEPYSFDHVITDYTLNPKAEASIVSVKRLSYVTILWEGDGDGVFWIRVYVDNILEEEFPTDESYVGTHSFRKSLEVRIYNPLNIRATHTSTTHSIRGVVA